MEAILTGSEEHSHGIKVRLREGGVGRVKSLGGQPAPVGQFTDLASRQIPDTEDSGNEFKEFYQYDREIEKLGGWLATTGTLP